MLARELLLKLIENYSWESAGYTKNSKKISITVFFLVNTYYNHGIIRKRERV